MTTAHRFFPPWTTEVPRWAPAQARFWAGLRFNGPKECWVWIRSTNFNPKADPSEHGAGGYGFFAGGPNGERVYAHRFAWELMRGPIPEGMVIDHLCENKLCCNPDHMEVVTVQVNNVRGRPLERTHCRRGHPMSGDNLSFWYDPKARKTKRICRACRQINRDTARAKKIAQWEAEAA